MTDRLPSFRIVDWPEPVASGETGALFGMSDGTVNTRIVMQVTVGHRRHDGAWVDVVTHRPDDTYDDLKGRLPTNMLLRAAHRLRSPVPDIDTRLWHSTAILVDGVAVEFDMLEYEGSWIAIGSTNGVFLTLEGEGVALDDVALVSLPAS